MGHRRAGKPGRIGKPVVWFAGLAAAGIVALAAVAMGQPPSGDLIGDLIGRSADERPGDFERDYLAPLLRTSCPPGTDRREAEQIEFKAASVPLQGLNPFRKEIGKLTFVAGFHLTSPDKRLGGLSGLDVREDGGLLVVADNGDFVWIDLAPDGITPVVVRIAGMSDSKGAPLRGKRSGDAEGLALNGDVALVSFEGDHRVLAYDLGRCGAAARGAPIAFGAFSGSLPKAFERDGLKVGGNQGTEGLAATADWKLIAGLETMVTGSSRISARAIEAAPAFDLSIGKDAPELVGLDVLPVGGDSDAVRLFSLHRSSAALASNAITILETRLEPTLDQSNLPVRVVSEIDERSHQRYRVTSSRVLAEMNVFVTIDNFEGIAASSLPDGGVRIYIVSDDNFSARQRTLLMIYDLTAGT